MQRVILFGCGMQSDTYAPGLSDQTPVGPEMDPEMPQCSGDPETPGGNAPAFVHILSQPPDTCLGFGGETALALVEPQSGSRLSFRCLW